MGNADNTSVKSNDGKKLASKETQDRVGFSQDRYENKQILNARKAEHLKSAREKARKKAKKAKADRKKNKK